MDFILNVDLVASSALFLVFIASNLGSLFPNVGLTNHGWVVLSAFCLLPTVLLKIQKLSFLSKVGSWIMLLLVFTASPANHRSSDAWFLLSCPSVCALILMDWLKRIIVRRAPTRRFRLCMLQWQQHPNPSRGMNITWPDFNCKPWATWYLHLHVTELF